MRPAEMSDPRVMLIGLHKDFQTAVEQISCMEVCL